MLKLPKMEIVEPMTMYSLSVNPQPIHRNTLQQNALRLHRIIYRHFTPYAHALLQVMELSPTGRLHSHGTITFPSREHILGFYDSLNRLPKINIEIDTIDDIQIWMDYTFKQQKYHNVFKNFYAIKPVIQYNKKPL